MDDRANLSTRKWPFDPAEPYVAPRAYGYIFAAAASTALWAAIIGAACALMWHL